MAKNHMCPGSTGTCGVLELNGGEGLDGKVMTLGCSTEIISSTHTHTHLSQAFRGFVGCQGKADGGGHDRCLQGQLWTSSLLTASHLLHIMSARAHTASWVNPSMLPHTHTA